MTYNISDEEMKVAAEQYATIEKQVKAFAGKLDELKKILADGTVERGESVSIATVYGTVTGNYRKGYERVSWDKDGLVKLAEEVPTILDHMKVSQVKPSASVAVSLAL